MVELPAGIHEGWAYDGLGSAILETLDFEKGEAVLTLHQPQGQASYVLMVEWYGRCCSTIYFEQERMCIVCQRGLLFHTYPELDLPVGRDGEVQWGQFQEILHDIYLNDDGLDGVLEAEDLLESLQSDVNKLHRGLIRTDWFG